MISSMPTYPTLPYADFIKQKISIEETRLLICEPEDVHPWLKPHARDQVVAAVRGTHPGFFDAFGLGKTGMQLETVRIVLEKTKGHRALIVMPLGVKQEFKRDAVSLGLTVTFVQNSDEVEADGIYLTNWNAYVDGRVDAEDFDVCSLDEAACLRSFGSETFGAVLFGPIRQVPYRYVATATPSPNNFIELISYADFLGIMEMGEAKTRFFARNSEKADDLTLLPDMEEEWWHWIASWGSFVQKPSDLGYSDEGYTMPPLEIHWHCVPSNSVVVEPDLKGQGRMFKDRSMGVVEASKEKRESIDTRLEKMLELRKLDPNAHRIIWHDLEDERKAIEEAIPSVVSVHGSMKDAAKENAILGFSEGRIQELAAKPMMLGAGPNFQHHCSWAIFIGIGFKFNDFIQSIHRIYRFLQPGDVVRLDLIYTEAEEGVRENLERKWNQDRLLRTKMSELIRKYGFNRLALAEPLQQTSAVERREVKTDEYWLAYNDSILECETREDESVGMALTSIPFSNQYQYSNSYLDFGHSEGLETFFRQMDYLTPHLFRMLKPGRVCAVHVKDRAMPGRMTGLSFTSIEDFHCHVSAHFKKHGFIACGMRTIVTDVVRENNQTYRLGWTEVCKDSSRMGCGLPEYLMLFRRPQSNRAKGYADERVEKCKEDYTRPRWQFDAHAFWRSSGDRLLLPEDLRGLRMRHVFRAFRNHSFTKVYDFDHDVSIAEYVATHGRLPTDFMLLQPQSWSEHVWTDIFRAGSLNSLQARSGRTKHLCPLPYDIVRRAIELYSMEGEVVFDPFSGLGTVPLEAVRLGRIGWGCELNEQYYEDSTFYLRTNGNKAKQMSLSDVIGFDDALEDMSDLPKELVS